MRNRARGVGPHLAFLVAALLAVAGCSSLTAGGSSPTASPASGTPTVAGTATPGTPAPGAPAWTSVVLASTVGRQNSLSIQNLNPISGHLVAITTATPSDKTTLDGVSPNGQLLAYHIDNGSGVATFWVANIDGSGARPVAQITGPLGAAVWAPDNAHLAVGVAGNIVGFDIATGHVSTLANQEATLVAYAPDGLSVFGVGTGATLGPGSLTRIPLDGSKPIPLTPRLTGLPFVISPDGKTVYYQNTGPAGTAGIYQVNTADGSGPTAPVRTNNDIPVGFTASGALIVFTPPPAAPALIQLGQDAPADTTLVANLVPGTAMLPDGAADVAVAPDGNGVVVKAQPKTGVGYIFYFTDLAAPGGQPKIAAELDQASRADLGGWDTLIITSGS